MKNLLKTPNQIIWNYLQKRIISVSVKSQTFSSRMMFNNLKQKQCNKLFFISVIVEALFRFFLKKKYIERFVKKRRTLGQIFCSTQNFLESWCLVDDLDKMHVGLGNKKENILLHLYPTSLKTVTNDLN